MSKVGQREIQTQRRVVAFLQDVLDYKYLGHWQDRPGNRNVERENITGWLKRQEHSDKIIDKALFELNKAAGLPVAAKHSTTPTARFMACSATA